MAQKELEQHRNYKELASVNADDILRLAVDTTSETITVVRFLREDSSNLTYRKYYFLLTQLGYDLRARVTDTILSPSPLPPVYLDLWTAQSTLMISDADGYETSFYDYQQHKWLAKQVRMSIRRPNLNLFVQNEDVWLVPKWFSDGFVFRLPHPYKQPIAVRLADPSWAKKYGRLMEAQLLTTTDGTKRAILTYVQYGVLNSERTQEAPGAKVIRLEVQLKPVFRLVTVRDSALIAGMGPTPWDHTFSFGDQQVMTQTAIGILRDSAVIIPNHDQPLHMIKWPVFRLRDLTGEFRPDRFYTKLAHGKHSVAIAKSVMRLQKTKYAISQIGQNNRVGNLDMVQPQWQITDVMDWPAPLMIGALIPTSMPESSFDVTYAMGETLNQIRYADPKGNSGHITVISPETPADKWTKSVKITEFWDLGHGRMLWMTDLKRYEIQAGQLALKQQYLLRAGMIVNNR